MKSKKRFISVVAALSVAVLLIICWYLFSAGSRKSTADSLKKIEVVGGALQCTMPDSPLAKPVTVRAVDASGAPASGIKLHIADAEKYGLKADPVAAVTDAGGVARFSVTSGKVIGDNYFRIVPDGKPDAAISVRLINGAQMLGNQQEGSAGGALKEAVGVKLVDADGRPRSGVRVFFSPAGTKGSAKPSRTEVISDKDGIAATAVKLPAKSGVSGIDMEISQDGTAGSFRSLRARVLSFDGVAILLNVLGGLALFMFGMKMMSDGLASVAGEKMRGILQACTRNRVFALAAGTAVTAIVQSSSAVSVMAIGFVNAGLVSLAQAIGVIFGANIGTTITAQIVAFKVDALAMPAIVAGLVMLFIKRGKIPELGGVVLGFGLLFFGMTMMGTELKMLAEFPSFLEFFRKFDCSPVDGVMQIGQVAGALMIGLLATMLLQSSSATTGIVIVLGAGGLINLYTAVTLILGANIGTTVTAQLAAIPANRPARQTALAHTLFNVFGVIIVLATFWIPWGKSGVPVFFYAVNALTDGNAFAAIPENLPRHIANAHTLFNVATALLLLPFTAGLAKLCEKLLPVKEDKVHYQPLEPHLLDTPALALRLSIAALGKMVKKSCRMVDTAVCGNFIPGKVDKGAMEKFHNREKRVDRYQKDITEYLSQIMRRKITPHQAESIPLLMHCVNDAERIADRAENMIKLTARLEEENLKISSRAEAELHEIMLALSAQMELTQTILATQSAEFAAKAVAAEEDIGRLAAASEEAHIRRMKHGKCTAQAGIIYVELLSELVAVSRHLSNIADRAAV